MHHREFSFINPSRVVVLTVSIPSPKNTFLDFFPAAVLQSDSAARTSSFSVVVVHHFRLAACSTPIKMGFAGSAIHVRTTSVFGDWCLAFWTRLGEAFLLLRLEQFIEPLVGLGILYFPFLQFASLFGFLFQSFFAIKASHILVRRTNLAIVGSTVQTESTFARGTVKVGSSRSRMKGKNKVAALGGTASSSTVGIGYFGFQLADIGLFRVLLPGNGVKAENVLNVVEGKRTAALVVGALDFEGSRGRSRVDGVCY